MSIQAKFCFRPHAFIIQEVGEITDTGLRVADYLPPWMNSFLDRCSQIMVVTIYRIWPIVLLYLQYSQRVT